MKHGMGHRVLGRDWAHRWLLFRNLVTELVKHDRIQTTLPKAKEVRRLADQVRTCIGAHRRRHALA
jgi:large subunit ribosomal protein L17